MIKLKRYSSGYIVKCAVAFDREGNVQKVFTSGAPGWSASRQKFKCVEKCELRISDSVLRKMQESEEKRVLAKLEKINPNKYL